MGHIKRFATLCMLCLFMAANASAQWIDVTEAFIINPNFDEGVNGWSGRCTQEIINGGVQNAKYTNGDCTINRFIEFWTDANIWGALRSGYINQDIFLPKGKYRLQADGLATWQADQSVHPEGVWLYVAYYSDSDNPIASTPMATASGKPQHFVITFELDENAWVELGVLLKNTNCNWIAADNFKLEISSDDYVPLQSISLEPESMVLEPSEWVALAVDYVPYDATIRSTVFVSSDPTVASVDDWGYVTALKEGKTRITAKSKTLDGYIEAYSDITVASIDYVDNAIVINEIQAANIDQNIDPSFNYGSWIELYNPTDAACGLRGLYITDDASNLKKHQLSQLCKAVQPHGYRNIWFDHSGIWNTGEQTQVPFKLNYDGGTIIISDGNRILLQQDYPKAIGRTSYARTVDGGSTWGVSSTPTPENSNTNMVFANEQLPAPVVDKDGQVFSGSLDVNVEIPEGATLVYVADNYCNTPKLEETVPNEWGSVGAFISDDGHFTISETTTFRFRLYKDGYLPSEVVTRSYINDNSGKPIIAITADDEDLYGYDKGIFTIGWNGRPGNGTDYSCNWNMDWDRPANFEYIDETGKCVFSQEVDISVTGGWSRRYYPKSFKIKAAKYYQGKNTLDYQFFDNKPFLKHKALQIRNGGSSNTNQDVALQEILRRSGLNVNTQSVKAVRVYVNGEHYGDLNMREPNNKHYGYANYGIDTDEMDQFEMSPDSGYVQKAGTKETWDRLLELSVKAADSAIYEEIGRLLDIDEYINYMACEFYIDNWDWPQNNVKGFRDRNDGKFHFVVFDLDEAFNPNKTATFYTFKSKKTYTFDTLRGEHPFGEWSHGDQMRKDIEFVTLFENLLQNETFCRRFVDALCVIGGSTFHPDFAKEVIADVRSKVGSIASPLTNYLTTTRQSDVAKRLKKGAYNFGVDNAKTVKVNLSSNIDEGAIYVNDMSVPTGKFAGTLYQPVTLKAIVPAGYKFIGWQKISGLNREYVSTETKYEVPNGSITQKFVAEFEPLTDDELAGGSAPVRINEVSAGNSIYVNDHFKKDDWIELYNTTDAPVDIAGMYLSDKEDNPQKYQIPADAGYETVIEPHGHLVVWASHRDAVGKQIHATFKLNNETGKVVVLTAADGSWSDKLIYAAQGAEETVGRYPDGGNDVYKMQLPTICKTNALNSYAQLLYTEQTDNNAQSIAAAAAENIKTAAYYTLGGIFVGNSPSRLAQGIYIVKYTLSDGTVSSEKIIIR